ncbi:non-ribosomal peptide synthetase [Jongsikchunia kroppenstedtii]|uniref:non-ribosomal peptide synthetase n=1 Tax=Jongsikchunia kroppenstedtii TaxID=1121721 RepID=UPI00036A4AEF|nr:non-ribosomal peptide synthetase [Jongsikchunia kroppenstedtii]
MTTYDVALTTTEASALPLTAAQRGIYYAQLLDPEVPMSVAAFVEFHAAVDPTVMDRAVADTADETESGLLRLVKPEDDTEPRVLVDRDRRIELGRRDFSDADDPRAAALAWIDEHRARTVDLFADPLLETYLLRLGPDHTIWYCWGHHLAFDGYAAMYMMVRVAQRYTAITGATEVPGAAVATIAEIAEIDRAYRDSSRFAEDREYWAARLTDGCSESTGPQPTSFSPNCDAAAPVATVRSAVLDTEVAAGIRAMAEALGVRPASVITATVAAYLARLNDVPDAMVSLPVAVRDSAILRSSAGLTSNVLPIRAAFGRPDATVSIRDLVCTVNREIKGAVRHQRYRHEEIATDLLGSMTGRRGFFGPMVNVMLFFEHIDFGALRGELNVLSTGPVEDASVNVYDALSGQMRLDLEANPRVYDPAEIDMHHMRLIDFLTRLVDADPDRSLADIRLVSDAEFSALQEFSAGPEVDSRELTLTDLLTDAAARFPEKTAIVDPAGHPLSYADFRERTAAVADGLRTRGVGPESVVGVALPRGTDQVVALHAVIRAGAAFVPIDAAEPEDRLAHILDTARPALVIVEPDSELPGVVTATMPELSDAAASPLAGALTTHPDQAAYLLFTSGSTGRPKGVQITHRAIVNRLRWMQETYGLSPEDRVLQKTPGTFDVSVWEYFWPLTAGATLVVARPDGHRDPWYLREVIETHGVTATHFVPSMLSAFADVLSADDATAIALDSLRMIFASGEALTPSTVARAAAITSAAVHNLYGPTEAAIDVTFHNDCRPTDSVIPIGRPVWNTRLHVLDRSLSPVPIGAVGELYLGGIQLARGYRGRADLTAGKFIADPGGGGGRLYRTGDLVRRRADGELEYLGRDDTQIKIRGQRVELGEIESALAALPGVRGAAAVARTDLVADTIVIGHVTGDRSLSDRDLRAELSNSLPAHMIPTVVMFSDELPITANGKLDRRALPEPVFGCEQHVHPETPLEKLVHTTVQSILELSELSMSAGFFDVGGNSLAATRIAARLSAATGCRLGIRAIFDATDIAAIVDALRRLGVTDDAMPQAAPAPTVTVDGPVPLSPAQHRLWLAAQVDSTTATSYTMPFSVRLLGELDDVALGAALADVVARHEPLRTRVTRVSGIACQHVESPAADLIALPTVHASDFDPDAVRQYARLPFDLERELPIRAQLLRHGADDHTLVVVIHHLAADGWSLAPLAHDLGAAYRARRDGDEPHWSELPAGYRQISAERAAWLEQPDSGAAQQIDYWSKVLADAPAGIELPYDRPRSPSDHSGSSVRTRIAADTADQLIRLAEQRGSSLFMVLHAAVAALLRNMSQSDDIVVGTPVSGRGDDRLDHMVGMFVNTLALRTTVDKWSSFADLLGRVRETDLAAFDHADVPFDRLVGELNPPRSGSGQPYFDVTVALENSPRVDLDFAGLAATAAPIPTGTAKFDLEFTFREPSDAGIEIEIGYTTALFDRETVASLASRLVRLCEIVGADPEVAVGDASVLAPHERLDLVPAVGPGHRPVEHLEQLLAAAVAARPDRPAIVCPETGRMLTYREFDAATNRFARLLIEAGAGPEAFVAVGLPRGIDWSIAVWSIVKSGAAWVPVDPAYPRPRIEFMLSDSGARLLVTDRASRPHVSPEDEGPVSCVVIDDEATTARLERNSTAPITDRDRRLPVAVDQPAYLIYTSGTTGVPKGVVVSHRGLGDFAAEEVSRLRLTPDSATLHLASPSFDASILEMLMAVGAAATMHIAPPGVVGGRELADLMANARVSHAFLTPSLLTTMEPDDLPDLCTLVIGGEHPNAEAVRRWSAGRRLINAYGPTEATVVATMSQDISPHDTVTIGRPIRGVSAMVLDERLRPVAPGAIGELYLSGPHLARGYHGVRPLTSKRFIANPYGEPGERMYRTGDLVRWRIDHTLEFRGRADHQAKVRGHRIELGEVNAAIATDDSVRDVITVVDGDGEAARLVSYITAADSVAAGADLVGELRDRLADRLPRYLVPSAVVVLDRIPTTPIGKVDMRALPAAEPDMTGPAGYVAPRTDIERAIAADFAELLAIDVDGIGREHDFFDLGGNSLLATQLVGRLEQRFDRRIAVRDLFDDARVVALARLSSAAGDDQPLVALTHEPDAEVQPGPAQQQLWFLNQFDDSGDGSAAGGYHIAFALRLCGDLDTAALGGALAHAVERHEPLRTRYPARSGRPVLDVIAPQHVSGFDGIDLHPEPIADADWADTVARCAAAPFDLTNDLPLRARLHRIEPANAGEAPVEHRLTIVIHHIAADGWSLGPLARDIASAYADLSGGREPQASPLPVSYRDYLRWQATSLGLDADGPERRIDELTQWWHTELEGVDGAPILAADVVDAAEAVPTAGFVEVPFDPALRAALRDHDGLGNTEFMAVHAMVAALLHRLHADPAAHFGARRSDLIIGTPVAGRGDPRLAELVGMFVNSVPLRTPVASGARFVDLLSTVRDADLAALAHADLPFERLVAALRPARTGGHPIFQIALTVDDLDIADTGALELDGIESEVLPVEAGGPRFDLELRVRSGVARFIYDTSRFSPRRVADLADRFVALAEQVVADPTVTIGELQIDSLAGDGTGSAEQTAPRHLADLIDDTVAARPNAIALDDGDRQLSYRDASELADRWAAALAGYDLGPESVIAVAIDRSIESVIATWAIAKAGAAMLPIDPRLPADRVAHMLSDSGAVLGITTGELFDARPRDLWWVRTDELSGTAAAVSTEPANPRLPDSCAYVIYTSGTTGLPKGVAVSHRGLAAFASAQTARYQVESDSRTLHFASPSFDAAMLELLLALDAGATMVIAPPTIYGGDELVEFLGEHAVTHAFVTPAALASAGPRELPHLKCLAVGGESFGRELVDRWSAGRRFLNCYGPTETTIVTVISDALTPNGSLPIGTPIDQTSALVLDDRLRPVPPYAPGELYLAGPGLARGYAGRHAMTAGRFVAAPTGVGPAGSRMYRTGDIVSRDLDGALTYLGRRDRQVKVRGFRIELDEVDSTLAGHPAVRSAVTVVNGTHDTARLVSYVVAQPSTDRGPDLERSLIAHVRDRLPRQMVPSAIVAIDAIPLTVNGKVDQAALPTPDPAATAEDRRTPETVAEQVVVAFVADALDLPPESVGIDDDFFEMGGTSLQATGLISRINIAHRGEPIRVRALFDNPVLARFAALLDIDADSANTVASEDPSATDADRPERFPLAPMQRRLWSLQRSQPDAVDYVMPFRLHLRGTVDVPTLRAALVDVVTWHAGLRTVYPEGADGPFGIVLDDAAAVVGPLTAADDDPAAIVEALAGRPFDLTVDAPLRVGLSSAGDTHTLVLAIHHIAADGASLPLIVGDLIRTYRERLAGRATAWQAAPLDYRDYALAMAQADDGGIDDDRRYWADRLSGAPGETSIAADATLADRSGGAMVSVPVDTDLRDAVLAFARSNTTSAFSVLHTATVALLHRLGVGTDLVIGTPVANRNPRGTAADDYRQVVGMFVNTVALRTAVDPGGTAQSLLDAVRDADLDAWDHLDAPFDDVVADVNPVRLPGRHPLFQIALSVHDLADSLAGNRLRVNGNLSLEVDEVDTHTAKFDLQLTVTGMTAHAPEPALTVTYARNRYSERQARDLAVRLLRTLRALIDDPGRAVGDIRVTDPLEVAALSPVSGRPSAPPRTLIELLDAAVSRCPDGIAALTEEAGVVRTISYRELDARANRLARLLLARGVIDGPEPLVAMAIGRSIEAVVAIWAIIRCGAAYVPVDPNYPQGRVAHMLDDSGARSVVTTSAAATSLGTSLPTVVIDDPDIQRQSAALSPEPIGDDERSASVRPNQLAYVIYTSGSTGTPKGVLVPHSGLGAVHDELADRMRPTPQSRVLHFASPSFDASMLEFLLAAAGASTLVIAPTTLYGGDDLAAFIDRHQVSHAFITPAAVATMDPAATQSLSTLAVGGEAVGADLVQHWASGRRLLNVYGPTETTIICTGSAPLSADAPVTIGTPNNGVGAVVLDARLHPVPAGVAGELYLLGDQLTRGYHRRPELTATRYVPAPLVLGEQYAGQRMYRTGDLVRWTADGTLDYLGRSDDQVQVRGFRVELAEIDAALSAHPAVRSAVTVADTGSDVTTLHGYLTAADGADLDTAELRRILARTLPRHLIPASFTVLDRLPLTPVGKIDRAALPKPQQQQSESERHRPPAAGLESTIAGIFADVLDAATVGAEDNFFDIGGNSLLTTTVATRLREAGHQVAVPDLFAAPTAAELAAVLSGDASGRSALAPVLTLRDKSPDSDAAPLFVFHPAIGLSWSFAALLPHIDAGRAVYGLQNPALSGERPGGSIGELAADYVARIREIAGHGPYRLLGWSLGGLIAHEVAVALQRAGEQVEQLILLDSYVVADHPDLATTQSTRELLGEFGFDTAGMAEDPDLDEIWSALREADGALADLSRDDVAAVLETFGAAGPLAANWQPRTFVGDAVFVSAADRPADRPPARPDWIDRITGDIADVVLPCSHARMLLPANVDQYSHVLNPTPPTPARRPGAHRKAW